jgi:hypothetical protein
LRQIYLIRLAPGAQRRGRTSLVELRSDADAIKVGRLLIEREATGPHGGEGLSVHVGRGAAPGTEWLGAWRWDGGEVCWDA